MHNLFLFLFLSTGIKCAFQVVFFSIKTQFKMAPARDPGSFTRCPCDIEPSELGNVPSFIKAFNKTASSQLLMVIKAHENINDSANGGLRKKHNTPRRASRCQRCTFTGCSLLNEGGLILYFILIFLSLHIALLASQRFVRPKVEKKLIKIVFLFRVSRIQLKF